MAKYYSVKLTSKYEAKVTNDASKKCALDEQNYEVYLKEIKTATNTIDKNLRNIINAVKMIEKDAESGKYVVKEAKAIREKAAKVQAELKDNRDKLSKQLDAEFRRQIKQWIAWSKAQADANSKTTSL
jgi:dsDNA-specific endonuclease/ATPase MutS2